jgi:hypothetical protein
MRGGRNKHGAAFVVAIFSNGRQTLKETDDADEAYSLAYGTPIVMVEKYNAMGSVEDSAAFSPKHPLWSRGAFLKWARSRGRISSRAVRARNNK